MSEQHEVAVPQIKEKEVVLIPNLCLTSFKSERGIMGYLHISRWINQRPVSDESLFGLRYFAALTLNRPGSNDWCGAVGIPTAKLEDILPWVTTTTAQVQEQLKMQDTSAIEEALRDLARQLEVFQSTLAAEHRAIMDCFAQVETDSE